MKKWCLFILLFDFICINIDIFLFCYFFYLWKFCLFFFNQFIFIILLVFFLSNKSQLFFVCVFANFIGFYPLVIGILF